MIGDIPATPTDPAGESFPTSKEGVEIAHKVSGMTMIVPAGIPFVKVTRTINRPVSEVFSKAIEADLTTIFPPEA
jgi:hypothetical protein